MVLNSILMGNFRGSARLRSLVRGASPGYLGWGRSRDGLKLTLDPEAYVDRFILKYGYYEREVLESILASLPSNNVFWDVGSNIGLHALTVKLLRPESTVIAFEPAPSPLGRLIMNARANKINIEILSAALGTRSGYAKIAVKVHGNSGLASLTPWPNMEYDGVIRCRVESADDLVSLGIVPKPSVMKIDVEGFEIDVLRGALGLLGDNNLKAIIFESDGRDLETISSLLKEHGFSVNGIAQLNRCESSHLTPNYLALR